jgi:HAD superfamily hydrolase (TIGR01509 family)
MQRCKSRVSFWTTNSLQFDSRSVAFFSPPSSINAFLFDIGNVLLHFDFSVALRALAAQSEVNDPEDVLARIERIKIAYEDGTIDRSAFLRGVFDVLRYRGTEHEFIAAWEDIFQPNTSMIALIEELHARHPLYLLSNTSDIHRDYIFRRYPFFSRFADGIYSFEVCASKPGPRIFQIATRQLRIEPGRTFFIDDLLPNIETARSLGFVSHHYHHEEHEALLHELRQRGVINPQPPK